MTRQPAHVIGFDNDATACRETVIDEPSVVDTPYTAQSWRHFENIPNGSMAGIWQAEPHLERCSCDYDELCHILEGTVRLTDVEGNARTFGPGESFVVTAGFEGTWENLTFVKKVLFIISA